MNGFPNVDPIPLPAPIWLFKALHITTLSLHFVAVEMLLGGLLIAILLGLLGRSRESKTAALALARRLTVVMTYVINLGVPPLLFAQVLYGRALYTSSVLIGVHWISVILLLTVCYWLLYQFAARLEAGRSAWWVGLAAWLLAGEIAHIYSSNMTLMLRPEVWQGMYSASSLGARLPQGDPTLLPRWLFMMCGGLVLGGLWMIYLAARSTFVPAEKRYLAAWGGRIAAVMGIVQVFAAFAVYNAQPRVVQLGLQSHALYRFAGLAWIAVIGLIVVLGAAAAVAKPASAWTAWSAALAGFLAMASMTIYRDGIRDLTLLSKGFDVWNRVVVTNWSVVILFLVLFVAGLGVVGWLVSVVARSQKVMESAVQS